MPLVLAGGLIGLGPSASAATCQNWTGVPPPSPGTAGNVLDGVAMVSACDAWAVGFDSTGSATQTLTEHWNGSAWAVVPSPSPGSAFNTLASIRAVSADDVWAVGSFTNGSGDQTLIEHWNGSAWAVVPSPSPGSSFSDLRAVRTVSTTDARAVGDYSNGTGNQTLTATPGRPESFPPAAATRPCFCTGTAPNGRACPAPAPDSAT